MNNNAILKKAFGLRGGKLFWCLLSAAMFLTAIFSASYQSTEQLRREQAYGFHTAMLFDADPASIPKIQKHRAVGTSGEMDIYGAIIDETGDAVASFGSVDTGFRSFEKQMLLTGRYPVSAGEIAIESTVFTLLNLPVRTDCYVAFAIQWRRRIQTNTFSRLRNFKAIYNEMEDRRLFSGRSSDCTGRG